MCSAHRSKPMRRGDLQRGAAPLRRGHTAGKDVMTSRERTELSGGGAPNVFAKSNAERGLLRYGGAVHRGGCRLTEVS